MRISGMGVFAFQNTIQLEQRLQCDQSLTEQIINIDDDDDDADGVCDDDTKFGV